MTIVATWSNVVVADTVVAVAVARGARTADAVAAMCPSRLKALVRAGPEWPRAQKSRSLHSSRLATVLRSIRKKRASSLEFRRLICRAKARHVIIEHPDRPPTTTMSERQFMGSGSASRRPDRNRNRHPSHRFALTHARRPVDLDRRQADDFESGSVAQPLENRRVGRAHVP